MKYFFRLSILVILVLSSNILLAENTESLEEDIEVVLGMDKNIVLDFIPDRQIQIGSRAFVTEQFIRGRKEITLKGVKPGKTNVTLRDSGSGKIRKIFKVKVTTNSQSKMLQDIQAFLDGIEGVEIKIIGDTVTLSGHIIVPDDIGKIAYILDKYKDVVNLVELSPHSQRVISKKMQEEIHASGLREVTVRVLNKLFVLEGVVNSQGERARAVQIATIYLPDNIESLARRNNNVQFVKKEIIQNFISVNEKKSDPPLPKMIRITAQFVELTKSFTNLFGFKWSPLMADGGGQIRIGKNRSGGVSTSSDNTLTALITNLFPKLSSARSAGHARVLQSGVIIIKDNVKGSLKKEVNNTSELGSGEFTKAHTLSGTFNLIVQPKVMKNEMVNLNINLNSTAITSKGGDSQERETLTNNVVTEIIVKNKESAVIGGVFEKKSAVHYDKDPPGGIKTTEGGVALFSFVRSKSELKNKTQFVMFVTPEILASASAGSNDIKRKFRRRR